MKHLFTFCMSIALAALSFGQTNPVPYNLASGPYVFNNWPAMSPAGTYPPHMRFGIYPNDNVGPDVDSPIIGDWVCSYNLESRSRIIGQGANGFSFLNTGNFQDTPERCQGVAPNVGSYVGAATIALNTEGMSNINGTWAATMLVQGEGIPTPREYRVRLEYRVGIDVNFQPIGGNVFSSQESGVNDVENFTFTLPQECDNQPVVQLRLRYYQHAQNDGGSRPHIRVSSISVDGTSLNTINLSGGERLNVWPNPSVDGIYNVNRNVNATVLDITGKVVAQFNNTSQFSLSGLAPGIYVLRTLEGDIIKLYRN